MKICDVEEISEFHTVLTKNEKQYEGKEEMNGEEK